MCVCMCPRKGRQVFRGGRVIGNNSGPAVPTGADWPLQPRVLSTGLAAPAEGSQQLRKALPGVWAAPREEPGGRVRRPRTGVNQPPLQAAV